MRPYNSPLWNFFKLKEGIDFNFILFQLQFEKFDRGLLYGLIVVDSLDVKHKLINIKYLDKTLINTANYTDCTIVSRPVLYRLFVNRFAVQKTCF